MRQGRFNQTAYRILMLLLWLVGQPLTMAQINTRFENHDKIGKSVSQDTLWLYINTLKKLGCDISRPTRTNGFCYTLRYHPFSYSLTPQDIAVLQQAYLSLEDTQDYWHVIHFKNLLERIFEHAANPNKQDLLNRFVTNMRTFQPQKLSDCIDQLETFCANRQLIRIEYESPTRSWTEIEMLPQKIFYYQSRLYLLGHCIDQKNASMLRLDRIGEIVPYNNPAQKALLMEKQNQIEPIIVRILNCTQGQYISLVEDETVEVDPDNDQHLRVTLKTENEFLLKQKLLSSGNRFQILSPPHLREELLDTLRHMQEQYTI